MANIHFTVDDIDFEVREPTVKEVLAAGDNPASGLILLEQCSLTSIDDLLISTGLQAGDQLFAEIAERSKRS